MTVRPNVNHFLRTNPRTAGAMNRFIGKVGTARSARSRRTEPEYSRARGDHLDLVKIKLVLEMDDSPDTSYLDQKGFEERKRQYRDGYLAFAYLRADAVIKVNNTIQIVRSPGVGGVEYEHEIDQFVRDTWKEEIDMLKHDLRAMGFQEREIRAAPVLEPGDPGYTW